VPFSKVELGDPRAWRVLGVALVALALCVRIVDAFTFPPDWGFDSSFNWRYIYRLSEDGALPHPTAGWATADPPLYFALAAAVMSGFSAAGNQSQSLTAIPLLGVLAGLGVVVLAVSLVRRVAPEDELRAWLAGGLLLYLPAHVHLSVMVNEEVLVALLVAACVWLLALRPASPALVGASAGLAVLTKLTGLVAVAAAGLSYAFEGWRRQAWTPTLRALAVLGLAAALTGGWWFARNRIVYGWFQPFGMPAHQLMFGMPPGERSLLDYVYFPFSAFSDPQLLNEDLLRSVWGSTYATLWFDGHRAFLPRDDVWVTRLGTLTLLLGLIPTLGFGAGLFRGLRRARARPGTPDLPLLMITAVTLAGFAVYTWLNPWFAVVKATSLSALALPFAFYASEALAGWIRRGGAATYGVCAVLAMLVVCTTAVSGFGWIFEKQELPGLEWKAEGSASSVGSVAELP
jgi:4-amino-4-deoxy-L-arabinose transferase-like glycosyltransferase